MTSRAATPTDTSDIKGMEQVLLGNWGNFPSRLQLELESRSLGLGANQAKQVCSIPQCLCGPCLCTGQAGQGLQHLLALKRAGTWCWS